LSKFHFGKTISKEKFMPVLVRYCLTAVWPIFLLATGATLFVLNLLFYLREFLDYLLVHHAGIINSFLLLLYIQPSFLNLAMPISFLVAIVIVYGRLSADREVVAVESAGFPISVLIWPMIVVGVLFSVFLIFFWDIAMPWGNTSFLKLQYKILNEKSSIILRERSFIKDFNGYILYVGEKDEKTDILKNVTVQLLDDRGFPYRLIIAKTGKMLQNPNNYHVMMDLTDGVMQQIGSSKNEKLEEFFQMSFQACSLDLSSHILKGGPVDFSDPRNISIKELAGRIAEQKKQSKDTHYYEVEFYKKFSMPFSALAFVFLGIPLALLAKAGSFTGPFWAVALVFVYWLFDLFGEYGPLGIVTPFWAMWLPDILFITVGVILIYWLNHKHEFSGSLLTKLKTVFSKKKLELVIK
jgi:lipopolysaccharide export system permease protein